MKIGEMLEFLLHGGNHLKDRVRIKVGNRLYDIKDVCGDSRDGLYLTIKE